ncbi:MAG: biopolymer transporter ExbD [Planctomycetes bacterium]|nr:biopolymer transporter ExbD [Planctomycetota bacterium]
MSKVRKRRAKQGGAEVDLTPMIDVTFQLIIFFMVVTTITTQDNVNLTLADALYANKEKPNAAKLFTVHIAPLDQIGDNPNPEEFGIFCKGAALPKTDKELKAILIEESKVEDPDRELTGRDENNISQNMIIIRCDARCPAGQFAKILEIMVEARLYKIKIAILKDNEN